jgi:hypothetical protein
MTSASEAYRHRGQYRFRHPIDYRYDYYSWPAKIISKCVHCGSRCDFLAVVPDPFEQDEESGGYQLVGRHVPKKILGSGACTKCGHQTNHLAWPEGAYFQVPLTGGNVWAWNEDYLVVLRAHISGDRVLERHLRAEDVLYHHFLSRLPKHVVLKRNRERIIRKIDEFIATSRITLRSTGPARRAAQSG